MSSLCFKTDHFSRAISWFTQCYTARCLPQSHTFTLSWTFLWAKENERGRHQLGKKRWRSRLRWETAQGGLQG